LVLGGVEIPYPRGLSGHSDGDVFLHSLMDAILGALGKGDIGEHFPPEDPAFKDISSVLLLKRVKKMLEEQKGELLYLDGIIIAEEPKLTPFKEEIKKTVSRILEIGEEKINIKATTQEGLGFIGRKEGIASLVTVLLRIKDG